VYYIRVLVMFARRLNIGQGSRNSPVKDDSPLEPRKVGGMCGAPRTCGNQVQSMCTWAATSAAGVPSNEYLIPIARVPLQGSIIIVRLSVLARSAPMELQTRACTVQYYYHDNVS
jgi:hypothetical protein